MSVIESSQEQRNNKLDRNEQLVLISHQELFVPAVPPPITVIHGLRYKVSTLIHVLLPMPADTLPKSVESLGNGLKTVSKLWATVIQQILFT